MSRTFNVIGRNHINYLACFGKSNKAVINYKLRFFVKSRRHWVAEAKRVGTSVTTVIVEALSKRFGEPDN